MGEGLAGQQEALKVFCQAKAKPSAPQRVLLASPWGSLGGATLTGDIPRGSGEACCWFLLPWLL